MRKQIMAVCLGMSIGIAARVFGMSVMVFAYGFGDIIYDTISDDFTFVEAADGSLALLDYDGSESSLDIPDTLNGKPVKSIESLGGAYIEVLSIPAGVEYIAPGAFSYNSWLNSIKVDTGNPYYASIDGILYEKAEKALLCYPSGIRQEVFAIPEGIRRIRTDAFGFDCYNLEAVTIPSTLETIDIGALSGCEQVKEYKVAGENPYYDVIGGSLVKKGTGTLVAPAFEENYRYKVPENITDIGDYAFLNNYYINSVTFHDGVKSIGAHAFEGCSNLMSLTIPASVTSIGEDAFKDSNIWELETTPGSYAEDYAEYYLEHRWDE